MTGPGGIAMNRCDRFGDHVWQRNTSWGYRCLRCGLSTGRAWDELAEV